MSLDIDDNVEKSDAVWEIITMRLPRTAPLLNELHEVINSAQGIIDNFQSTVLSTQAIGNYFIN